MPVTFEGSICFSGEFDDELRIQSKDSKSTILGELKSQGFDVNRISCDNLKRQYDKFCFEKGEYDYEGSFELEIQTGGTGSFVGEVELTSA